MPTQRFYNLKEEKRRIIRMAAMEECARAPYEEISINKIIKAADISRGSFYTYFEDKDDMIKFLMNDLSEKCVKYVCQEIQKARGDIITAAETITFDLMEYAMEYPEARMYRSILLNIGLDRNMKAICKQPFVFIDPEYQEFSRRCFELCDTAVCPIRDEEQMSCVLELLLMEVMRHVAAYHMAEGQWKSQKNKEMLKKVVHEQLEIIRRGLR